MKLHWLPLAAVLLALMLPVSAFGYYRYWNGDAATLTQPPTPTPSPTAIPRTFVDKHGLSRCNYPTPLSEWGWFETGFFQWSPDGSQVLFSMGPEIYAVSAEGNQLRMIADASWEVLVDGDVRYRTATMTSFDVSPDSSKIVYSRCGRRPPGEGDYQFLDGDRQSQWVLVSSSDHGEYYEPLRIVEANRHSFELAVSNMDGTDVERLNDVELSNFPAWSPDGSRIAFFGDRILYTVAADGTDLSSLVFKEFALRPPAWAPDGQHIAVLGEGPEEIYTVKPDGSDLTTIVTDALSAPSWSPDGQRIAVAVPDGEGGAVLRTFAPDGSEPVTIASIAGPGVLEVPEGRRYSWVVPNVSWSPDGSKVMYGCGRALCAVNVDDGSLVFDSLPLKLYGRTSGPFEIAATWSPDGSMIAVLLPLYRMDVTDGTPFLFTMDSDGANAHVLMAVSDTWCLKPVAATSTPPFLTGIPYGHDEEC